MHPKGQSGGLFAHSGLTGPGVIPYVSVSDGGAVNGQPSPPYEGNQAVMSSALSEFILAHRAGMKPALPRELGEASPGYDTIGDELKSSQTLLPARIAFDRAQQMAGNSDVVSTLQTRIVS